MLKIKIERRFKKDIETDKKSGKYTQLDFEILKNIITTLQEEKAVDPIYKRHSLVGTLNVKSVPIGRPFRFKLDAHYEINWTPFVF